MAALCSAGVEKTEIVNDEIEYVAEEISKQSTEDAAWYFLSA